MAQDVNFCGCQYFVTISMFEPETVTPEAYD
jgi:hypothetical protein